MQDLFRFLFVSNPSSGPFFSSKISLESRWDAQECGEIVANDGELRENFDFNLQQFWPEFGRTLGHCISKLDL